MNSLKPGMVVADVIGNPPRTRLIRDAVERGCTALDGLGMLVNQGIIQTPFNNHVRIDEPMTQGWNVMSRTRHLDGIPFRLSLQFDMELIPWKRTILTYAATTYWYACPGATSNLSPQPKEAALAVPTLEDAIVQATALIPRKPGAIECEGMKILSKSGEIPTFSQDMSPWDSDRWSSGHQLTVKAGKAGDFVELEFPVAGNEP